MTQRISEAGRYTVYYTRHGQEAYYEARARDRGEAIAVLEKELEDRDFTVTRVVPGWPERNKKGTTT